MPTVAPMYLCHCPEKKMSWPAQGSGEEEERHWKQVWMHTCFSRPQPTRRRTSQSKSSLFKAACSEAVIMVTDINGSFIGLVERNPERILTIRSSSSHLFCLDSRKLNFLQKPEHIRHRKLVVGPCENLRNNLHADLSRPGLGTKVLGFLFSRFYLMQPTLETLLFSYPLPPNDRRPACFLFSCLMSSLSKSSWVFCSMNSYLSAV